VDETYIKIKKAWMYVSRAVDSEGNTLEFLLSATRDAAAAIRFFVKALHSTVCSPPQARPSEEQMATPMAAADPNTITPVPRVINVDKHAASPKAMADLKASGVLPESVELTSASSISTTSSNKTIASSSGWSSQGWVSFPSRRQIEHVPRYEVMHMMRKGQVRGVGNADISGQVTFIASLFGVAD